MFPHTIPKTIVTIHITFEVIWRISLRLRRIQNFELLILIHFKMSNRIHDGFGFLSVAQEPLDRMS